MKKFWTDKLDNLLRRHYPKGDLTALAARIGVTKGAVKSRAAKLGISRKVNVKHPWSDRQLRLLRERFADTPMEELIRLTKHGKDSIENKAHELKLRKSREYKAMLGRKTAQMPQAVAHRFKKGQAPANKGKRAHEFRSPEAIAKCRQTEFKPGHRPANTRAVGSEYVRSEGYVYIKVAEGRASRLEAPPRVAAAPRRDTQGILRDVPRRQPPELRHREPRTRQPSGGSTSAGSQRDARTA